MYGTAEQEALTRKLGIKPGFFVYTNLIESDYMDLIGIKEIHFQSPPFDAESLDFVHVFSESFEDFMEELNLAYPAIKKTGMVWISWMKGKKALETGLNRDLIRDIVLETDLVDTKVCSVDETWSALKFMYRRDRR